MNQNLPAGWITLPLEECMEAIIDYRGKSPDKTDSGVPLITAKIVKSGQIEPITEYIAEDDFDDWMRRGMPKNGDVVITTEAPLGEVAQLDNRKVALAQRIITLRGKSDFLENTYLKYHLISEFVQEQLRNRSTGTTVLGIRQSELRKIQLVIPPFAEQKRIAHILGTLDDKIELNRRMNATLEAIAQALFKSWFVDFDPVRAKMSGESEDSICQRLGLTRETLALFPDRLVESELGEIPGGWHWGTLRDIAENPRRGIDPKAVPPQTPYIGLEHMPRGSIALGDWGIASQAESNKFSFETGEILFGKLRPYFHKVGVAITDGICSTDILVIRPLKPEWFAILLCHISSVSLIDFVATASEGTRMPRTNWADVAKYDISLPDFEIANLFMNIIKPMIGLIKENLLQKKNLSELRDTLLPKLLSGEIEVGDL
jgi:type I restriction enzyme, S subunit